MLPPFSSPQAYGEHLYGGLLRSDPTAWAMFGSLREKHREGTATPWERQIAAALSYAHSRYGAVRYQGAGAPSWGGYGLPEVNTPGISIGGSSASLAAPRPLHPAHAARLIASLGRCYAPLRKDPNTMYPYQGCHGMRPGGPVPNPAFFAPMNPGFVNPYLALQAAAARAAFQAHEDLPPSIQGMRMAGVGAGRAFGGGHGAADFHAPPPTHAVAFHPSIHRGSFGFGFPYAYGYGYPYYAGIPAAAMDPGVYCRAHGYFPPGGV